MKFKVAMTDEHPFVIHDIKGITPDMLLFKKHEDDTGYDLIAAEATLIPPGESVKVPSHIVIEPPAGYWYMIKGRSSSFEKRRLLVVDGVIDYGYRGPLFTSIINFNNEAVTVNAGESLAQIIFYKLELADPVLVNPSQLSQSTRGTGGFGSTDKSGERERILDMYRQLSSDANKVPV